MYNENSQCALTYAFAQAYRYKNVRSSQPPLPTITETELAELFDVELTKTGRSPEQVIDLLTKAAEPGLVGNTGPNFFGWVMGASSEVGVAADLLTSVWGQNAGIYKTAPSAAVAEDIAAKWLLNLLDLPRESSVGFTTGATMASFIGLAAARYDVLRRVGWNIEVDGLQGAPQIQIILSEEAHASVHAVLKYLGFGNRHFTRIPTDKQGRMIISEVEEAACNANGPAIVIAQAGHINSGAFDHFEELARISQAINAWLHIDGAFGLWARSSSTHRSLTKGIDLADSWAIDGHKWLQVPYDSGYAIVRDSQAHRQAMSIDASYLNRDPDDGRNPSEYGPELSRRARGFTTWAALQSLGSKGLEQMIDRHCQCAQRLYSQLKTEPGIRILNDVCLNQLAITFTDPRVCKESTQNCRTTDAVIEALQSENKSFVSGADWRGYRIMRVSIISEGTSDTDIDQLTNSIVAAWRKLSSTLEVQHHPTDNTLRIPSLNRHYDTATGERCAARL
ncbi:MAG: aspartate aminotransferase family protein [Gammaproteobacteria bacterium]|nr:aspartate aminotransferase family protein [Gammaproteobacteria bacterium]